MTIFNVSLRSSSCPYVWTLCASCSSSSIFNWSCNSADPSVCFLCIFLEKFQNNLEGEWRWHEACMVDEIRNKPNEFLFCRSRCHNCIRRSLLLQAALLPPSLCNKMRPLLILFMWFSSELYLNSDYFFRRSIIDLNLQVRANFDKARVKGNTHWIGDVTMESYIAVSSKCGDDPESRWCDLKLMTSRHDVVVVCSCLRGNNNFDQSPFHLGGDHLVCLQKWTAVSNFPESKPS